MKKVTVIGLGYVGLPLACLCAEKGFEVSGIDLDKRIAEAVNKGKSHIKDAALEQKLASLKGKIAASVEPRSLKEADTIVVCVPTPAIGSKPDLAPLKKACETISKSLSKGQLVIIESTVYPGTIEEIVKPILEKSRLKAGEDFFLGHCPERIDPGNTKFTLENIPRVLSCLSETGKEKAKAFYEAIVEADILVLENVKDAEAVKVMENSFRDINIAFVNELAKSFDKMGIDIGEVIRGASTKPFGFMPFYPGPGVGGHCIAQDPYYLIARAKKAGFRHRFLSLAREINESMPSYTVSLVEQALEKIGKKTHNSKVAVLGLSYKPNVDDTRKSPSLEIATALEKKGAVVKTFDPWVKSKSNCPSLAEAVKGVDAVILATHHSDFVKELTPEFLVKQGVKAIIDARNVLDKKGIKEKGLVFKGIGK